MKDTENGAGDAVGGQIPTRGHSNDRPRDVPSPAIGVVEARPDESPGVSRRALMRGVGVALPTILTLNSGTAFALSSLRISPSALPGQVGDNFVCLDTTNLVGPPYEIVDGAYAKAIPVTPYQYVNTQSLLGVDLTKPSDITTAIKQKGIVPLRADQLCNGLAADYVPVIYNTQNRKFDPLLRSGAPVVASMPASANMSVSAFNSLDASKKLTTTFLV